MVRAFCARGNHEGVKCAVHAAAGVLVGVCAFYNITAACFRRDRHLRVNAIIYALATAWGVEPRGDGKAVWCEFDPAA